MSKLLTNEQKMLREVWIEAFKRGGLKIPCANARQAKTLQMRMYKVSGPAKKDPSMDAALAEAALALSIEILEESTVHVYAAEMGGLVKVLANVIGTEVLDREVRAAKEMEQRMMERLGQPVVAVTPVPPLNPNSQASAITAEPARKSNPYNTRDE